MKDLASIQAEIDSGVFDRAEFIEQTREAYPHAEQDLLEMLADLCETYRIAKAEVARCGIVAVHNNGTASGIAPAWKVQLDCSRAIREILRDLKKAPPLVDPIADKTQRVQEAFSGGWQTWAEVPEEYRHLLFVGEDVQTEQKTPSKKPRKKSRKPSKKTGG